MLTLSINLRSEMGSKKRQTKKEKFKQRRARNKASRGSTITFGFNQAVAKVAAVAGEAFAVALREHVNKVATPLLFSLIPDTDHTRFRTSVS